MSEKSPLPPHPGASGLHPLSALFEGILGALDLAQDRQSQRDIRRLVEALESNRTSHRRPGPEDDPARVSSPRAGRGRRRSAMGAAAQVDEMEVA